MKPVGTIHVLRDEGVALHSYMAPEDGELVCSQLIETRNAVVIVDVQLLRPYAQELRRYAETLGKPIDRVIVTHTHPDHWLGLEFFRDVPSYALGETKYELENYGGAYLGYKKAQWGDLVTAEPFAPTRALEEGSETIDGLTYQFRRIADAEARVALSIALPELKTLIAQDLIYNGVYPFFGEKHFDGWMDVLRSLQASDYALILPGHGEPTDRGVLAGQIDFLADAKQIYESGAKEDDLKQQLSAKYPHLRIPLMLDFSNSYLYHPAW